MCERDFESEVVRESKTFRKRLWRLFEVDVCLVLLFLEVANECSRAIRSAEQRERGLAAMGRGLEAEVRAGLWRRESAEEDPQLEVDRPTAEEIEEAVERRHSKEADARLQNRRKRRMGRMAHRHTRRNHQKQSKSSTKRRNHQKQSKSSTKSHVGWVDESEDWRS